MNSNRGPTTPDPAGDRRRPPGARPPPSASSGSSTTPMPSPPLVGTAFAVVDGGRRSCCVVSGFRSPSRRLLSAGVPDAHWWSTGSLPAPLTLGLIPSSASVRPVPAVDRRVGGELPGAADTGSPHSTGSSAAAMIGVWVMAFLTDWGAHPAPAGVRAGPARGSCCSCSPPCSAPATDRISSPPSIFSRRRRRIWAVAQRSVNRGRPQHLAGQRPTSRNSISLARAGGVSSWPSPSIAGLIVVGPASAGASRPRR